MTFGHKGTGQIWIRTGFPSKRAALEIGEELRVGIFERSFFQNEAQPTCFFLT
jgi:hypothetical protein